MYRELKSRRNFLRLGLASVLCSRPGTAAFEAQPKRFGEGKDWQGLSPTKEIRNAEVLDISPDSKNVCLYFSKHPFRSFTWNGAWAENKAPVRNGEDAFRVLHLDTWTATYSTRLPALPYKASFFAEGHGIYVEIPGVGAGTARMLVNLEGRTEQRQIDRNPEYLFEYWALAGSSLLGSGRDPIRNRGDVLTKVEAPDYRETMGVPFALGERTSRAIEAPIRISSDRRTMIYAYNHILVCRRTEDLQTVWHHTGDELLPFWRAGISSNGDFVAAAAADTVAVGYSRNHYVAIFGGKDGKEMTRVPALGVEDVALSPDGKILAAGRREPVRAKKSGKSGTQPTVELYNLATGEHLATIIHDQFFGGGGEFLYAGVKTMFSPDGRFLITTGLNTKVWSIAGL